MKYFHSLLILLAISVFSCGDSQPFTGNKDNPLLIGTWTIIEIDNTDALANKELAMHALFSRPLREGSRFRFEAGAGMQLVVNDNDEPVAGQYEIRGENETLLLKLEQSDDILKYRLKAEDKNTCWLMAQTVGDVTNLKIRRQK